jgi:hypothetical protein
MSLKNLPIPILHEIAYFLEDDLNFAKCFNIDSITYVGICYKFLQVDEEDYKRRNLQRYDCRCRHCELCGSVLDEINTSNLRMLGISGIRTLNPLPKSLSILKFNCSTLKNKGLIYDLPNLRKLELREYNGYFEPFKNCPLEEVILWESDMYSSILEKISPLKNCPIKKFFLNFNESDDEYLSNLLEFKSLKELYIQNFEGYLTPIQNMQIEILALYRCKIYHMGPLTEFKSLKKICLVNTSGDLNFLGNLPIKTIILENSNCGLSMLKSCKYLKKIHFVDWSFRKYKRVDVYPEQLKSLRGMNVKVIYDNFEMNMKTKRFKFKHRKKYSTGLKEFFIYGIL